MLVLSMRAPCAPRILAGQAAARRTNLRLWETIAGSVPLFPACSLQGTPQLQRVEPSARGPPISRIQGVALYFSLLFRGAAERGSATSVAGRAFRAPGAVTACRLKESQGQP